MNARQVLSGLGWSALATVINAACQFAFMALLARLLDPAAFGLMAMAAISLRFASFFSQLGFGQALIQRPVLGPEDTSAALAMALAIGAVCYLAMIAAAPLFAASFSAPELVHLIGVLGASLVLGTVGSLPLALLRREARFKRVTLIEVSSFVVGYGAVGIACAAKGLGVWSLVAATLCQQALVLVLAFATVRYPVCFPVPSGAFRRLWSFGSRYSMIGFLEFLFANVESLFVGRVLGKVELGLFNRAITLTNLPVEFGVGAVNKVLFPALAGMQRDRGRLADGFQMLVLGIGLLSTGMACAIAAAAPDIVALVLGKKWTGITPIVAIVAFAVPPMFMFVACGVTLDSLAALGPKLRLQASMLAVKAVVVLLLARHGLPGIALAVVASEYLRLALGMRLLCRLLDIDPVRLRGIAWLLVGFGVALWTSVRGVAALALGQDLVLWVRVGVEMAAAITVSAAAAWLLLVNCPGYAPLQRFELLRAAHARALQMLRARRTCYP